MTAQKAIRTAVLIGVVWLSSVAGECQTGSLVAGFNEPPNVTIESPVDGAQYPSGATVEFEGVATDPNGCGGPCGMTGNSVVWSSDVDGQLGIGTKFNKSDLSIGDHTITLSATDPGGATGTESVGITILPHSAMPIVLSDAFDDGSLPADRWDLTVATSGTGQVTQHVEHRLQDGNPVGFRYMEHRWNPGPAFISVQHFYTAATYDPGTEGAIDHIAYSEDRRQFNPPFAGAAIGTLFIVEQGGTVYSMFITGGQFTSEQWEHVALPGLTAQDFTPAGLDFSASGTPITFGYARTNTINGTGVITTQHGIDNWRVEIHRE